MPLALDPGEQTNYDSHYLNVTIRLRGDATVGRVRSELDSLAVRLRNDHPRDSSALGFDLSPLMEQFTRDSGSSS